MSVRAHPRLVGAFVLGAVALIVAAIVVLSSGGWFQPRNRFAVFFPGSLSGLGPGSQVTFRGVKVGEVTSVTPFVTGTEGEPIQIEVVFELHGNVVETPEGVENPYQHLPEAELAKVLIENGVRARLRSTSLLTGQKAIDLDFLPGEPARLAGLSRRHPELPTMPTDLEKVGARFDELSVKIAELPLDEMLEDVRKAITAAREILESQDLQQAFAGAKRSAQALEPLLTDTREAVGELRSVLQRLDGEATDTGAAVRETLTEARGRVDQLEHTLETIETTLRGADDARVEATRAFDEMQRTLRTLRDLVDYIQTHPEAVLQGKEKAEGK